MNDQYKAAIDVADQTRDKLLRLGMSENKANDIHQRIVFAAGSLLPPVSGQFHVNLTDTKVN